MKAIGYVRVSTEEQARGGISIDAQSASINAYCTLRGLELTEVVVDAGVSAGKPLATREGGQRLLDVVRRKDAQAVVAHKLDRIFRDAGDCLTVTQEWDHTGVSLHLIDLGGQAIDTATAMGRFFLTVMAGAAEMERNLVSERTKAAMAFKRSNGERVGAVPYGYRLDDDGVSLVEEKTEQAVITEARRLRSAGLSLRAVAGELARKGFKARNDKTFAAMQVKRMVA